MGKKRSFSITCPCCQATLKVDAELEAVVSHEPPPKQHLATDLAEAARALREKESHRDEQFRKSFDAERKRGELLNRKFDEAFEKVREEGPGERGPRDIDLD